ncbi:uncharacterized protein [Mycetomoellerius zeteki]|uniref:uncharacterized protein n=1 Tax=Mycetomoellerius zeteki TaxID=64791 RepID=UPI00084EC84B|nr:PREDICTED: uncharacterized protein LOC108721978 [Trachymyrmex zeteki]
MVLGLLEMFRVFVISLGFQMEMLYINCVCVLKACFKEINDNLENLGEIVINNIPRWIYHEQRHPLLIKLKALKKQHLTISDTVKMLNMIFSLYLLATIALSFKQIIFYVFTLIVWACETGKNEAIKIGTTIHDIHNSTSDVQIKDELNLFSLQILHCNNKFSAIGFTIDATLLTAMACFKEINDNLENLGEIVINNIPRWIYHEQRHPLLIKLKALKKQHLMICDTVKMLNMIFSLHLLATIALSFKQIIFYVLALIVWACETSKNEAIKIGTTIHDVLNSISNIQIKDELNLFSLQILHCDNTFSAKGLTIDATLITMMVSSVSINFKVKSRAKTKRDKWKLFHATDFQSLMYPNFIISKILGIFPYRIKATSFEISKPRYILWTIIFCVICVYELTMLYKLNLLSEKIKVEVPKIISLNFSFLYGFFVTVISYVLSGPRMRLLQTVSDISSRLPQKSYQKLSKLIHAKDIFGFFFHFWLALIYSLYSETTIFGLLEMSRVLIILLAFQMDMLYINCVCVLKTCFKDINDNLESLQELVMNNIPRWIYHNQRHPFLLIKLKALKKQHLMISDTVQMLNMIFSLHLLASIAVSFKQIIFYLYFNVIQWQNGISLNRDRIYNAYFISFLIYYLIRLTLIVWACETGKNEAIKIGTTIHDVLNSISDVQIKDELNLFSLQILHCNNTFSVKGLTVDATLLTVMVSSVSTYLLILIQFLIMTHSCDSKANAINYTQTV